MQNNNSIPFWSTITREERFFTCILFHDIRKNPIPFWNALSADLDCGTNVKVIDQGFEVCFFRDLARKEYRLIERHPALEKQTFDLVLTLSNQDLVIIEAKAHQYFDNDQIDMLKGSKNIIMSSNICPIKNVYLAGLCSSKYNPKKSTREQFDAMLRWDSVARIYPGNEKIYNHANDVYGD